METSGPPGRRSLNDYSKWAAFLIFSSRAWAWAGSMG